MIKYIYGIYGPDGIIRYINAGIDPWKALKKFRVKAANRETNGIRQEVLDWIVDVGPDELQVAVLEELKDDDAKSASARRIHFVAAHRDNLCYVPKAILALEESEVPQIPITTRNTEHSEEKLIMESRAPKPIEGSPLAIAEETFENLDKRYYMMQHREGEMAEGTIKLFEKRYIALLRRDKLRKEFYEEMGWTGEKA
jgi:hypothetical protein